MEGRVAVLIVSIAERYDYSGTDDRATSFTGREEMAF